MKTGNHWGLNGMCVSLPEAVKDAVYGSNLGKGDGVGIGIALGGNTQGKFVGPSPEMSHFDLSSVLNQNSPPGTQAMETMLST